MTPWSVLPVWAVAISLVGIAASDGRSQGTSKSPDAAEVAAGLRARGNSGAAVAVLAQARGPESRRKMDEIGDSLVAIAAGLPGHDRHATATRATALSALMLAGMGETGVVGIERGVPYAGAADRLMRIALTGQDVGVRASALRGLTLLPDRSKLFPFLRQVATSKHHIAYVALTLLANETGPEGHGIARALYVGDKIIEPTAREIGSGIAKEYGWR
jgi:hypothetical protein